MAVLEKEPERSHVKLARIIATSQNASEEELTEKLLTRARALGADAVVLGKVDMVESMGRGSPFTNTMSNTGVNGLFSGGWWSPFYFDPWTYAQTAGDQSGWTMYRSGLAIKYLAPDKSATETSGEGANDGHM